ncbi:helix-turn-helix transcriptional regulator [Streptosporangium sp. NPDC023615]|uniref:helix-turn-helix transcriptional regulator n=1 Tax=Streptosporangium sp. NPDC023615 TaxID=3154794 RepID=UPI0034204236
MRNNLLELRQAKGLTQVELGGDLNVSRQTIAAIETGRYLPSLPLAFKIARYFGHTIEEIFYDNSQ